MPKQPTMAELIGVIVLTSVFCISTLAAWRTGAYLALMVMVPLALLGLWGIVDMMRQGIRQPTAFEHFEARLLMRFGVLIVGGGVAVFLLARAGYPGGATLLLLVVLLTGLVSASKLRSKSETSAGYKRRVHYHPPEQPQQSNPHER